MDFVPCVLFLDGEFWGAYYITESYNKDYVNDHYGIPKDNVALVKDNELTEGTESDYEWYQSVTGFIREKDMTDEETYQLTHSYIDFDSYMDFYAAQIYISRCGDWPGGNEAAWCCLDTVEGSPYEDMRWRWMLYDVNSSGMELSFLDEDSLSPVLNRDDVFASLATNDNFKRDFSKRLVYMGEEIFTEEKCNAFIDQYLEDMLLPLCESNRRFYGETKEDEILKNAEEMKLFFKDRLPYVKKSIIDNFGAEYLP